MEFSELKGKIIISVDGLEDGSDEVVFDTKCGKKYRMYHESDCCEHVFLEDVCGDVKSMIGKQVYIAEACSGSAMEDENGCEDESTTWTFYNIVTSAGAITIRWYGSSNGYYSESVYFEEIKA